MVNTDVISRFYESIPQWLIRGAGSPEIELVADPVVLDMGGAVYDTRVSRIRIHPEIELSLLRYAISHELGHALDVKYNFSGRSSWLACHLRAPYYALRAHRESAKEYFAHIIGLMVIQPENTARMYSREVNLIVSHFGVTVMSAV